MKDIALIFYGNGGELGNFSIFATTLKKELDKKYEKVIVKYINRDFQFFDALSNLNAAEKIAEVHVFAHAIGAGIFIGYHDETIKAERQRVLELATRMNRRVSYDEVVNTETGSIQTDDFLANGMPGKKTHFRSKFNKDAIIKIWGCNSGVENWVYSDGTVVAPSDTSVPYYWRALNEFNYPKKSIAKTFAEYFNVKVYGAKSGSHIEVMVKNTWLSSDQLKKKLGHWPSANLPTRLTPDKGGYVEFLP
jgi:hypothetical protein